MPNKDKVDKPTEAIINHQMLKTEVACRLIRGELRENRDLVQVKYHIFKLTVIFRQEKE